MSDMPWDHLAWIFFTKIKKYFACANCVFCFYIFVQFSMDAVWIDSDYLYIQTDALKLFFLITKCKQSVSSLTHYICPLILHYRCWVSAIQLCLDNNLMAKSRILVHRNTVLLCIQLARDGAQQYWQWLRELKIQMREEMEWHRCAVVQREQHAHSVGTQSHAPPHTKLYTRA